DEAAARAVPLLVLSDRDLRLLLPWAARHHSDRAVHGLPVPHAPEAFFLGDDRFRLRRRREVARNGGLAALAYLHLAGAKALWDCKGRQRRRLDLLDPRGTFRAQPGFPRDGVRNGGADAALCSSAAVRQLWLGPARRPGRDLHLMVPLRRLSQVELGSVH